jgi:signal transduction histidine kinase
LPNLHLVLSRSGTVLAASEGAPASWVGLRLDALEDAPADLHEAGRTILAKAAHAACPLAMSVFLQSTQQPANLTVIDALPLQREPTDLRALLTASLDVMRRQATTSDVTLNVVVDDEVPRRVSLDPRKIAWVMTALVGSALRYVRHGSRALPGGSITVRATYDPAGPEVSIEVQDDGAGIPADKLVLLFSGRPDRPRLGLALSMVRDVLAAHGGAVDVRSDTTLPGRGTTVRITLPVW